MTEKKEKTAFDKLNTRQKDFVLHYIQCRIASRAYKLAYSTETKQIADASARSQGSILLTNHNIKQAIDDKLTEIWDNRQEDTARVYDELKALGHSDIKNVVDEDGNLIENINEIDSRSIKAIHVRKEKPRSTINEGGEKVEVESEIVKIELYDKKAALSELVEILEMKKQTPLIGTQIVYLDNQDEAL